MGDEVPQCPSMDNTSSILYSTAHVVSPPDKSESKNKFYSNFLVPYLWSPSLPSFDYMSQTVILHWDSLETIPIIDQQTNREERSLVA
jgi:hypothetical protein